MQHPYQYYDAQFFVWSPGAGESFRGGREVKVVQQPHLSAEDKTAAAISPLKISVHVIVLKPRLHVFLRQLKNNETLILCHSNSC